MELQCFNEIVKIEKLINEIADFDDTWRNLSAQLEAVKKMARYTSLTHCAPDWQSELVTRVELEIDDVATELSERWEEIGKAAETLNDFREDIKSQETAPSFSFQYDLQHILAYLMDEVDKRSCVQGSVYQENIPLRKPDLDTKKAVLRCKQCLQAVINRRSKKS